MSDLAYVGRRVVRVDAAEKVTGRAVYGVDLKLPGMLHAKILRSTVPHARIVGIDTTKAERLRGVRAVVTGKDAPYTHNASIIKDWPFFAREKVRHVGEAVAAVAAVGVVRRMPSLDSGGGSIAKAIPPSVRRGGR